MVGEFETNTTCSKCKEAVMIVVVISNSDATGNGFFKEFEENCDYCSEIISGEIRLNPEFDFL